MSFEKMLADRINRSVPVEQELLDIANGKRPLPSPEDCRRMAMDLGVPTEIRIVPGLRSVIQELDRATIKFPSWPTDVLHALAVVGEEFGELTKAALQSVYEPSKGHADDVKEEAIQTAAMALRFVESLDKYTYHRGAQHYDRETKCDGNHGGPRCGDPECWNDSP